MTQVGLPFQKHSRTSQAAAESMGAGANTLRAKVYRLLKARPQGATDEEMQTWLNMPSSTQRPRRIELVSSGHVKDSGQTRATRSGRQAVIWVASF